MFGRVALSLAGTLAGGWDLSGASFVRSKTGLDNPSGVVFSPDGTKMYVSFSVDDYVEGFSLSTAWDISTATSDGTLNVLSNAEDPRGISISSDGTSLYLIATAYNEVVQYTLSTAWDISTASYTRSYDVSAQTGSSVSGMCFSSDGTKMLVSTSSPGGGSVYLFTLSTSWNISTLSFSQSSSLTGLSTDYTRDVFVKPDGTRMYVCVDVITSPSEPDRVDQYDMSTAWSLSTKTLTASVDLSTTYSVTGIHVASTGQNMYLCGTGVDRVDQYSLE